MQIEIDNHSGFCFGVTTAIKKAEEELSKGKTLYCLGDIVHNDVECERLKQQGLIMINHAEFKTLKNARVLLRAHGEPPETYALAKQNNIELIDATCPVVLRLQKRIKQEYERDKQKQIVILGKPGHAEVLGLIGQTSGKAIVLEHPSEVEKLNFKQDICLYSQTTKSLEEFQYICNYIDTHIQPPAQFYAYDTICRQVSNRLPNIQHFASCHDVIIFVSGLKSSNGKVLFNACLKQNKRSYQIDNPNKIDLAWLKDAQTVGICGATSTPKWLMEQCKTHILNLTTVKEQEKGNE